jgi:hypothetical protein
MYAKNEPEKLISWYCSSSEIQAGLVLCGASGGVVVKALCYKPAGHGFNS